MIEEEHAFYCFEVVESYLDGAKVPNRDISHLTAEYPLFVTWKSNVNGDRILRGCIVKGTFASYPLHQGLYKYSIESAFKDSRFDPIIASDLPFLDCTVSILTDFEDVHHFDWSVGVHGIRIQFTAGLRKTVYSATYLPSVAAEQNWTKEETLRSLIRKSGYRGKIKDDFFNGIRVQRYQSKMVNVTYQQYMYYKSTQ